MGRLVHNKLLKSDNNCRVYKLHNEAIINLLKKLSSTQGDSKFFKMIIKHVETLDKIEYAKLRQMLCDDLFYYTRDQAALPFNTKSKVKTVKDLYSSPTLDKVEEPYLGEALKGTYTLVLDLDETLIHSNQEDTSKVLVRPGAIEFVKELASCYELVVFTAGIKEYADWALSFVDPEGIIPYKLYREHATKKNGIYVKDISKLGRNLKRVIIIDNVVENFQFQSANGIFIKPWKGDMNDKELVELLPILKEIVKQQVSDVRTALRHYRDSQLRYMLNSIKS
eukprot:TRINITY_DN4809_c0_g1_i4.p1 TRINITY_DN4809_c0_g1~~TRINITY_DN4809_c0_g1_i4.p1  ORF type:complete len:281 (-),score=54.49 TRINITY_DN4809_c0_g1_i4:987-1829(-)